jgi:hypothetical protein
MHQPPRFHSATGSYGYPKGCYSDVNWQQCGSLSSLNVAGYFGFQPGNGKAPPGMTISGAAKTLTPRAKASDQIVLGVWPQSHLHQLDRRECMR